MNEIRVLKNDMLPPRTMVVSPDLFQLLTDTPELATARRNDMLGELSHIVELIRKAKAEVKP
jgi:hypothetical protein